MLTRRQFGLGLGAAAAGALIIRDLHDARGAEPIVVKLGSSLGLYELPNAGWMCGNHKKLGFYAEEGVAIDYTNTGNAANSFNALVNGVSDYGLVIGSTLLPFLAQNPDADLVSFYAVIPQPFWYVAVKPDSPYKELKDLKGKSIGIVNQGDTGYFGAKAMFKELGIDPASDVNWVSVGAGGPAGQALAGGRVDALAEWDVLYSVIEKLGFPLRALPNTPGQQHVIGATYGTKRATFEKKRDVFARYFRAVTKSTLFAYNNREAAVRLFFDMYPEALPKGKTQEQAVADGTAALDVRKEKWFPDKSDADQRIGAQSEIEWVNAVKMMELEDKFKDPSKLYTNDIVDECNKFDKNAIVDMAKSFKF
jgi:NitT/TauT family transport system substrate-binding protein